MVEVAQSGPRALLRRLAVAEGFPVALLLTLPFTLPALPQAMVIVAHEPGFIARLASRAAMIRDGRSEAGRRAEPSHAVPHGHVEAGPSAPPGPHGAPGPCVEPAQPPLPRCPETLHPERTG